MTEFKVGDKVEVVGRVSPWLGAQLTITEANRRATGGSFDLRAVRGDGRDGLYDNHEVKLVSTTFKKGDIVAVKPGAFVYENHKGKTLIVDGLNDEPSRYPYKVRALGEGYESGHDYRVGELIPGEPLAEWEIELLDIHEGMVADLAEAKAAHPSNGKVEAVEHPAHYGGDTTYEVIKVAEAWGLDKDAYLFNVLKYIARAGKKGSRLEDLKKGGFYLNRRITQEEAK